MLDPAAPPGTSSPGLDRRALWLSVGGGTLSGLLFVGAALFAALTHRPVNQAMNSLGQRADDLLGDLLFPLLVSLLARRRSFLWAALGLAVDLFWTVADRIVTHNWAGLLSDLRINSVDVVMPLVLICAPISLVRYLICRNREQAAHVRLAQQQAWNQPAPPQESVWPPPPTRPPL